MTTNKRLIKTNLIRNKSNAKPIQIKRSTNSSISYFLYIYFSLPTQTIFTFKISTKTYLYLPIQYNTIQYYNHELLLCKVYSLDHCCHCRKVSADTSGAAKSVESFNDVLDDYAHDPVSASIDDEDRYDHDSTSIVNDEDGDYYSLDDYDEYDDYSMDEDEDYSDSEDADEHEYDGGDEPPESELEVGDVSYLAFGRKGGHFKKDHHFKDQCFSRKHVTVRRNHRHFNFKLESSHDRKCADRHRQLYEYGQFRNVHSFDQCARTCVNRVPSFLLNHLQGVDYNCHAKACNCLFDKGTLNRRNGGNFKRIVTRNLNGRGRVRNIRFAKGFACGSLH